MFLRWAKNKVKKWVKENITKRTVIEYLLPLAISVLDAIAKRTKNTVDDEVVRALRMWYDERGRMM